MLCIFVSKISGTHRGRGCSRGADRQDLTSQQEEQYQGHQTPKVPHNLIPDLHTIPSIHFTQHMTPNIPHVHMSGSYMIPNPPLIPQQFVEKSREQSEHTSSHGSTTNKQLITPDGKD